MTYERVYAITHQLLS